MKMLSPPQMAAPMIINQEIQSLNSFLGCFKNSRCKPK